MSVKRGGAWVIAQFVVAGIYLLAPWHRPSPAWAISVPGFILLGVGGILFLAGIVTLGRSLTPLPVPAKDVRLITSGVFGLVRHPIYSGLIFAAFGWATASNDWLRLLLSVAVFLFFNAKASFEEKVLTERFPEYPSYARETKRFVPWVY